MTKRNVLCFFVSLIVSAMLVAAGFFCGYLHVIVRADLRPINHNCIALEIDGHEYHYLVSDHLAVIGDIR